jgi:hypothetical protein
MVSKTGIAVCGASALLLLGAGGYVMTTTAGGFNSDQWKAQYSSRARDNPRAGMVTELEGQLRPGMTRTEVVALLGEPETEEEPARYVYALGMSRFGLDYEYFIVEFDREGKLVRHFLKRG